MPPAGKILDHATVIFYEIRIQTGVLWEGFEHRCSGL